MLKHGINKDDIFLNEEIQILLDMMRNKKQKQLPVHYSFLNPINGYRSTQMNFFPPSNCINQDYLSFILFVFFVVLRPNFYNFPPQYRFQVEHQNSFCLLNQQQINIQNHLKNTYVLNENLGMNPPNNYETNSIQINKEQEGKKDPSRDIEEGSNIKIWESVDKYFAF